MPNILVVDDEESIRRILYNELRDRGYVVKTTEDGWKAIDMVKEDGYEVVILDIKLPGIGGMEVLKMVKQNYPETEVVIITGFGTIEQAVQAMKEGAYDYITKPFNIDELGILIEKALERRRLLNENRYLRQELKEKYRFSNIIGVSPKMQKVFEIMDKACETESSVLIQGKSGTGKELVARAIHYNGRRKDRPFIPVDCGSIVKDLLESELFGHVKGAFTGAIKDHTGLFQIADSGTIFLDEITEMDLSLQAKLLRVLQEREIKPVGSNKTVKVDVRVIAATNKEIDEAIQKGLLREDLFYRLNVISIHIPPLQERIDDVPLLANHFLEVFNKQGNRKVKISHEALELLKSYDWPGNVRELKNVIERAFVLGTDDIITPEDLPNELVRKKEVPSLYKDIPSLREAEFSLIKRALKETSGNQTQAAKLLGVDRKTLHRKLKRYNIPI